MSFISKLFHRQEEPREIVTFSYLHRGANGKNNIYAVRAATAPAVITYNSDEYEAYGTMTMQTGSAFLQELLQLCVNTGADLWNGFRSAVPDSRGVGDGFSLRIIFADGTEVLADGQNRYPEGYRSFRRGIAELFAPKIKEMLHDARKNKVEEEGASALEEITASFSRRGSFGSDRCRVRISRAVEGQANFELTVCSDGTYVSEGESTYRAALPDAAIPFARFAALPVRYDRFRWQPRGAAFDGDGESFRLSYSFEDAETSAGAEYDADYHAFRSEFLTLIAVMIRVAETEYGWLPDEEPETTEEA